MPEKLNFHLTGQDGNAFALLGEFQHQAKKAGWTKEEIHKVFEDAKSGNYDHLLQVLLSV
ncbi:MAG: hypothetical protein Q7R95_01755 [bacterium]|nr:hypothetical protein [bacterium]